MPPQNTGPPPQAHRRSGRKRPTAVAAPKGVDSDSDNGPGVPKKQKLAQSSSAAAARNPDANLDVRNGLHRSLRPISDVFAAFQDMSSRSQKLLDDGSKIHLRVATMCSGTEAPIFALKMLEECFDRMSPGKRFLKFSHLFSVEIVPFKQAYIARNTDGAILFNDVRDFIEPKHLMAPTAMGAMAKIPGQIDLLVAGCSCVDFSSLNSRKQDNYFRDLMKAGKELTAKIKKEGGYDKESHFEKVGSVFDGAIENIDNLGTSAQTFFSLLKYVRDHRPKVVILENVMGAPWDDNAKIWFPFVGYSATFARVDTKDFYIPQTRTRGYLVALDDDVFGKSARSILDDWSVILKSKLARRASSPVNSWLLPPAHPLTERARQDDSEKALSPPPDADWERSKARHALVRHNEKLGNGRPITQWGETNIGQPYDRMDRLVTLTQPKRVLDCIDIYHLREMKNKSYDLRFKNRIHDLSQNVDRGTNGTPLGMTGCITPSGIHFLTDQCRMLSGYETLALQGLPLDRLELATETQDQLRDLSGNAMSTTVIGAVMLALITAIKDNGSLRLNDVFECMPIKLTKRNNRLIDDSKLEKVHGFSTMAAQPFGSLPMLELFNRCRRYCFCNGSAKYSTNEFLKCTVCSTVRCKWCAGNPAHNFSPVERPSNFFLLSEVDQALMKYLPATIGRLVDGEFSFSAGAISSESTIAGYPSLMNKLNDTIFYYQRTRVTEIVTVCYIGQHGFELRAALSEGGLTWYLYLDAWSGCGEDFRKSLGIDPTGLEQPVAKAIIDKKSESVLPDSDSWQLWVFKPVSLAVSITQFDGTVNVGKVGGLDSSALIPSTRTELESICGTYQHKPDCDAPENSLHVHHDENLFLFKESGPTRLPHLDSYVISGECRPLEPHEHREVLIRFTPGVNLRDLADGDVDARIDGFWGSCSVNKYGKSDRPVEKVFGFSEYLKIPSSKVFHICETDSEQQVLAQAGFIRERECDRYGILEKYKSLSQKEGHNPEFVTVEKADLRHLNDFVSHLNIKISEIEGLEVKFNITDIEGWLKRLGDWKDGLDAHDSPCGQLPRIQWIQAGGRYVAHHLSEAMTAFEDYVKKQVPPFEVRVKVVPSPFGCRDICTGAVQYLFNHKNLARKAVAYLPLTKDPNAKVTAFAYVERNAVTSQNMHIDAAGPERHSFVPFRNSLKDLSKFLLPAGFSTNSTELMRSFKTTLSKHQARSLEWMLWRELGNATFVEQEVEEEIVSDLKLRFRGYALREASHPGGILADDVGYGKTVITLALMHCQEKFDNNESVERRGKSLRGTHLKATLVLVPPHLVGQWATQALKFLPIKDNEIFKIENVADLMDDVSKRVLKRLREARLIIASTSIFASTDYHLNLARLAGSLDPPFENGTSISGRAFEDWYADAASAVRGHVSGLLALNMSAPIDIEPVEALYRKIEGRREAHMKVYQSFLKDYNLRQSVRNGRRGNTDDDGSEAALERPRTTQKFVSLWQMLPYTDIDCGGEDFKREQFLHVLEAFTYARVVYDEFSYDNPATTMFAAGSQAYSKWILSATPPTRNLAAVCYTARLINVHVARPIHTRQGMPRITEGPQLADRSNAEDLQIRKFVSDGAVRERHGKGREFLESFATANPLDSDLAGGISVDEKVVVCEMKPYEFIHYHDLQQDLRSCCFDANLLPKESRALLRPVIGDGWGSDGRSVSTEALIHRSSQGSWLMEGSPMSILVNQRRALRFGALRNFRLRAEKAVWLSERILSNVHEAAFINGRNATSDVCILLRDIWEGNHANCGGIDTWRQLTQEIAIDNPGGFEGLSDSIKNKNSDFLSNDEKFIEALYARRTTSWADYYELQRKDLKDIDEDEARGLLRDIGRVKGSIDEDVKRENSLETLKALIGTDDEGLKNYRRIEERIPAEWKKVKFSPEQLSRGAGHDRPYFHSLCRSAGILFDPVKDKIGELIERLKDHNDDKLDESDYVGLGNCRASAPDRYPHFNRTVQIRGGKYTFSRNDVSNTAIELRKAFEQVLYAMKQERIVLNLTSEAKMMECDGCNRLILRDDLHFVCECGHVLCAEHLDSQYCGGDGPDARNKCPSLLKHATMPLKKINSTQRLLYLGPGMQAPAPCEKISEKMQMLANTVKATPDDEYGIVFAQFDSQLEQLQYTLRRNGIGFSTSPVEGMRSLSELSGNLSQSLQALCDERAIPWGDTDGTAALRKKLRDWDNKYGKRVNNPKVRLLKLNDATSAGTNLQYANHVMFFAPLVVSLQQDYDAFMKQARGRCVRYGQRKTVNVYHFVTANTIEVDVLELRKRSHILVRPGKAIGRLHPAPPINNKVKKYDILGRVDEDTVMTDVDDTAASGHGSVCPGPSSNVEDTGAANGEDQEQRVTSILAPEEIWKAMNEWNWLTTVGIEH